MQVMSQIQTSCVNDLLADIHVCAESIPCHTLQTCCKCVSGQVKWKDPCWMFHHCQMSAVKSYHTCNCTSDITTSWHSKIIEQSNKLNTIVLVFPFQHPSEITVYRTCREVIKRFNKLIQGGLHSSDENQYHLGKMCDSQNDSHLDLIQMFLFRVGLLQLSLTLTP